MPTTQQLEAHANTQMSTAPFDYDAHKQKIRAQVIATRAAGLMKKSVITAPKEENQLHQPLQAHL